MDFQEIRPHLTEKSVRCGLCRVIMLPGQQKKRSEAYGRKRDVANFFVNKRKNKNYIPDDPTEIQHVDEVLKLLQVMTGDARYKRIFGKKKPEDLQSCRKI